MCTSVCRICLVDSAKMFYVINDLILAVYEKLTSAELKSVDRPQGVCYICLALLQRCCRFSEMARRSEQILTDMFNCGVEITQQNILTSVCGVNNNIIDLTIRPTQITTVNRYDTVETSVVNIKQEPLPVKEENTLSIDYVLKEESTETEEITNNNSFANDSIATVLNDPNDVTSNNLLSSDEQYEEKSTIHIDSKDNVNQFIIQSSFMKNTDVKPTKVNLYRCDHCTVTFRKKMYLISHKKLTHQKDRYKLKRNIVQKDDIIDKIPTTDKTPMFHVKQRVAKVHMKRNTGKRQLICEMCGQHTVSLSALQRHIHTHTGERPYACTQCDRRFRLKNHLIVHMQRHNGEKPYSCDLCLKKFTVKGEVVKHMRTHTGEKPYSCTQCDKSFSQAGYLAIHKKLHTGEKPYVCPQCDLRFSSKANLGKHVKTHTAREKRHACLQCNKRFYTSFGLKRHNTLHTGEKPHACEMCPKSFSQRSDLVIHVRTHTGEKPYSCTQCDRTFPTSSSLVKHKKKHTGDKTVI